jgi:hypothetical protein
LGTSKPLRLGFRYAQGLPSTGIPYVIVNGTVVVKDSKVLKDVYPDHPIRNAVLN